MSPLVLVGVLLLTILNPSLADVKHVLDGSAHPPDCNCNQQQHHHHQQQHGFTASTNYNGNFAAPSHNSVPGSVAFWWADANSPFKYAYDSFKKCTEKGNCLPPVPHGVQVTNSIHHGSTDVHKGQAVATASTASSFGPINIKGNPFLNGNINVAHLETTQPQGGGAHVNLAGNPFLSGHAAYSGSGQAVATGAEGFLGVQPRPFSTSHPSETHGFPTAHPSAQSSSAVGAQQTFATGVPSGHQFQGEHQGKYESCKKHGYVCVELASCINGVINIHGEGLLGIRQTAEYCEIGKEVCCRVPESHGSSYQSKSSSSSSYSSNFATGSSSSFGSVHGSFANLSGVTSGKSSIPVSTIKFAGSAGLSPGQIKVIPINQGAPNPHISVVGESGSDTIHSGSSGKVVRNTTPNPNLIFQSTVDYSNDKLDQLSFASTIRGPPYLPPISTPIPTHKTPELELPSISTYQPKLPTTPRPFVTSSIIPGPSIVSVYTPSENRFSSTAVPTSTQRPYTPPFVYSTTKKPFVPSTFINYVPPKQTSGYLPPYKPTTSKPYVTQPTYTHPAVIYTQPPTQNTPFVTAYVPPKTQKPYTPYVPPSTPKPFTYKPYIAPSTPKPITYKPYVVPSTPKPVTYTPYIPPSTPKPIIYRPPTPQPTQTVSHVTGYVYSTPTPPFEYPKVTQPKPLIPSGSIHVEGHYITPKQPGYSYPTPTTPRPTYSTFRQTYTTPRPTPSATYTVTNKYTGYSYPTPTPTFTYPKPSTPQPQPSYTHNEIYVPPKISTQRPTPPPTRYQVTSGYSYPTPSPTFGYQYPSPSTPQPVTRKPTTNQYLPPRDENPFESVTDNLYIPPPVDRTGEEGKTPPPFIITPTYPETHLAGCAAALKCVQEIYCTADGFISPVPVVLTKEQEFLRVPTTDCVDKESGVQGKCCRDANYVDPWPSANLINGIDNGQYREDPSLGQYFAEKQRPVRSELKINTQNLVDRNAAKVHQQAVAHSEVRVPVAFNTPALVAAAATKYGSTCGIRNPNIPPKGPGALDANFAEIPWQAMVLRDTNRSLLCGGVIVKPNAVLTAAHCVEGLATSDILIKGGEWKLGIDEEPLPFQIVKVAAIIRHPEYKPGVYLNDLALLMLEEKLRVVENMAPICLPPTNNPPPPQTQCIVTGWGKHVLQVHLRGAIMRLVDVNILDNKQCTRALNEKYQHVLQHYSPEHSICAYSANDQCKVDYGSALACANENGQYTLAGIFSWDTGCKDESQIGAYSPPDVEWIESTCSKPLTHLKALDRQYRNHQ